jgi:hypothetical protein
MWRRVVFVRTVVSEDRIASIYSVEEYASEEVATEFFVVTAVKTSDLT